LNSQFVHFTKSEDKGQIKPVHSTNKEITPLGLNQ